MNLKTTFIVAVALLFAGIGCLSITGIWSGAGDDAADTFDTQVPASSEREVAYQCADGKGIVAGFSDRLVTVALSDGRSFTLEQKVSASGARYANEGDQVVFWDKGGNAFLEEEGTVTFEGCSTEPIDEPVSGEDDAGSMETEGMMIDGTPEDELDNDMIDAEAGVEAGLELQ